jgi:hypothetical protein
MVRIPDPPRSVAIAEIVQTRRRHTRPCSEDRGPIVSGGGSTTGGTVTGGAGSGTGCGCGG